ncbi:uncharacterized protein NEMAJ01_2325, partial [Nematocida major]|uniref:uncharacterized protein n=1 Tax=Nematocida major TaxID=1912982 RepID=UPI0020072B5B
TEFTIPSQVSEYEFFQISCLIHLYTRIFHGLEGRIVYERTRNPNKKKKECIVDCSNIEMLINPHQYKAPTDASEAACTPKMMEVGDIPQEMVLSLKKREELCATHKIKPNSDTPIISCNREYLTYSTDIQYLLESYYNEYYTETTENPIANAVIITILCVIFFVLYCALLMAVKKTFFKIPPRT